jgi:phage I-like protein
MAWPWVSRELLRTVVAAKDAELATVREALTVERQRAEAWREQVAALTAPKPAAVLPERTRDAVIDAIMQRAGSDGRLVRHLSSWAMKERTAGAEDQAIIDRIVHWQTVSDDVGIP